MWVKVKKLKQQENKSIVKFVSLKQYFVSLNIDKELVDAKVTLKKTVLKQYDVLWMKNYKKYVEKSNVSFGQLLMEVREV
jgi:hypothetical protein